jgi:anti-sigma-K factor RskA
MSDERSEYLASKTGSPPVDRDRLDLIRDILGREATWSEPPPEVADRLLAAIGTRRKVTPVAPSKAKRGWRGVAAATLAAALVAVVLGVLGVFTPADERVVPIVGTDLQPEAAGEAAIREADAGWWIRLDISDLPAAEVGTYYEGWVWNDDGEGVSIGTFHMRGDSESVVLWSGVDPADYPAIWVTLEDEDGDPSASDRIVMWGRPDNG